MKSQHEFPSKGTYSPPTPELPSSPPFATPAIWLLAVILLAAPILAIFAHYRPILSYLFLPHLALRSAKDEEGRPQPNILMRAALKFCSVGPIPNHVAFIMDGNRRYARKHNVHTGVGHETGRQVLKKTLDWCMRLGVRVVTVYAFSIENFKRKPEEVELLMDLAAHVFDEYVQNRELFDYHGISVRVIGDRSLLPVHVVQAAARAEAATKHNTRAILNICIPYTSRHEMTQAISRVVKGLERGWIGEEDVSAELVTACMDVGNGERCRSMLTSRGGDKLAGSEKADEFEESNGSGITAVDTGVDLLVRTSGEVRLSDFLLWQVCDDCQIHFLDVLWPEFTFWHMLPVLFAYQLKVAQQWMEGAKGPGDATTRRVDVWSGRIQKFLDAVHEGQQPSISDNGIQ